MIDGSILSYIEITFTTFLVNLVPAFAPPSFLVLSVYQVNNPQQNVFILALLGSLASVCGKSVMYHYAKFLRRFIPRKYKKNLNFFKKFVGKHHLSFITAAFLFSLGPFPSNMIFIPAGLSHSRLLPIAVGFGLGRILSYSILLNAASATLGFFRSAGLDISVFSQVIGIAGITAIIFIDWERFLNNKKGKIDNQKFKLVVAIDNK